MPQDLIVTALSDTHELHHELDRLPGGDLLIHAGDHSMFSKSYAALESFADWVAEQDYVNKVITLGNHEFFFEHAGRRSLLTCIPGVHLLLGSGVVIEGLHIWGSAVTPLYGAAFGMSSAADRVRHWAQIPSGTDILVTHGPAYGVLDRSPGQQQHMGDPELLAAVDRVQPLVHVHGHVHGAYGTTVCGGTTVMNVALLGQDGALAHRPMHFRLPGRTKRPPQRASS